MGKYENQFVYKNKPNLTVPEFRHEIPPERAYRIVYLDKDTVPMTDFYLEALWFWPREIDPNEEPGVKKHAHDFDEVICFIGTNPEDLHDLGGEVELWIDDEKHLINRSFMAFVPAGVPHCPLQIRRIERPIFHFTAGPSQMYA